MVRACGETTDRQCGRPETCVSRRYSGFDVPSWLEFFPYQCDAGQYLWGFDAVGPVKTCRQCPAGLAGLNGVLCERCGALEEPYYLDSTSCVCKAPAAANLSGVCECPAGYGYSLEKCERCGVDTYSEGGLGSCRVCGAGNTTGGRGGASVCEACALGKYRLGGVLGCASCAGVGKYAANSSSSACTGCSADCVRTVVRWSGPCPDGGSNYSLCEPCLVGGLLPAHAKWSNLTTDPTQRAKALEECAFECDAGYYHDPSGSPLCTACNASLVCAAGRLFTACTAWADSHCDEECVDHDKPLVYSHWKPGNVCAWECDAGWVLIVSDYVMFKLYECV